MIGLWLQKIFVFPGSVFKQGAGLYSRSIKKVEDDIQGALKKVNELTGKNIFCELQKLLLVRNTMYLLTEWEVWSGKYFALGQTS